MSQLALPVNHRQPDRRLLGRRPLDPVAAVGGEVDVVARPHLDHLIRELQPRSPLEHKDPLVFPLIVPKAFRRRVAMGDDPLDADIVCGEQGGDKLIGKIVW